MKRFFFSLCLTLLPLIALPGGSVLARESAPPTLKVSFTCRAKAFQCRPVSGGSSCLWSVEAHAPETYLNLISDQGYPNAIYRARYRSVYDNHVLTLDIIYNPQNEYRPFRISANLDAGSVMAESSSRENIDISLRNQNYGRGFTCGEFRLIENF
ncbi:MAG: hypothetical protein HC902_12150 [Calothrix sp. SM1_5_4]|nr:hypothetical protein [Calothrix sp. SM1_5_4]